MGQRRIEDVSRDFEGAELGDTRRSARLVRIVEAVAREPGIGFPQALESAAELEAFYRFINSEGFDAGAVLEPHRDATLSRAVVAKEVVFIHDTTTVEFRGEGTREGLGYTTALGRQGFLAHVSLCLCASTGVPLGVPHIETFTRTGKTWSTRKKKRTTRRDNQPRESARWIRAVEATESSDAGFGAIHVMDAEADFFDLMRRLHERSSKFVIRAGQLDRCVEDDGEAKHLRDAITGLVPLMRREISLSARAIQKRTRGANGRRKHPPRSARLASVGIGCTSVVLRKTKYTNSQETAFKVNVVRVWETSPPPGEPPVDWVLFTSEPSETKADLERIVDLYRLRWTIEEYFKALKTGCALERRQMESYDALCKVLAILAPIACRLMYLRGLERTMPKAPASRAFTPIELELLQRAPAAQGCKAAKTVADALALLARLGGHLKNNGPPGWLTLGRGYEKLLLLRIGWKLAMTSQEKSDQC